MLVRRAKMAEPIEVPFRVVGRMCLRNDVGLYALDGVQIPHGKMIFKEGGVTYNGFFPNYFVISSCQPHHHRHHQQQQQVAAAGDERRTMT